MSTNKLADAIANIATAQEKFQASVVDRVETLEAAGDRPKAVGEKFGADQNQYKDVFLDYMRKPTDLHRAKILAEAVHDLSSKDVTIASDAGGGYAVPQQISNAILQYVKQRNPFRQYVRVDQCSTGDYKILLDQADDTAGWVAEDGSRAATSTPQLREISPTGGEMYAYPQASNWSLQDIFFDVESWLVNSAGESFSQMEHECIISGSGTNRPTGLLNTTPVSTADGSPSRAAAALQYVACDSASPVAIGFADLVDLMTTLKSQYLAGRGVAWAMHRTTFAAIKKLESTAGDYVFSVDPTSGGVGNILGFPIILSDYMPTYAAGNNIIIMGDFAQGYVLVDRNPQISLTVDQVTNPGHTRYYLRRRVYGQVGNNDALKVLQLSDS